MKLLLTLLVTLGISMGSYGSNVTGNNLLEYCNEDERSVCFAYLLAVIDTHNNMESEGVIDNYFCPPKGVVFNQIAEIIVKHMKERPQQLHFSGSYLTLNALIDAFPCED